MVDGAQTVVTKFAEVRSLHTSGGKSYWLLTDVNRKVFKTWSPSIAGAVQEYPTRAFEVTFHEDHWQGRSGPMVDLLIDELFLAPEDAQPMATGARADTFASAAPNDEDHMSKSDWDAKEDRDAVRRLLITHLQIIAAGGVGLDAGFESYEDMQTYARKCAVADLEWIRTRATSDVPF